jgi:hypothetical protein
LCDSGHDALVRSLIGGDRPAAVGGQVERVCRVEHEAHVEAEIGADPRGGLAAHVRLEMPHTAMAAISS